MISVMRHKMGPIVVGIIVGLIAFVFVFESCATRSSGWGKSGANAGSVNGEIITLHEFNREYSRRLEFFKSLGGGQISDEMIKKYKIKESVFREIANRKVMVQEAEKRGVLPSDAEIRKQIVEIPAFQKDGRFDRQQYKQVLEANSYSTATFEKMVRDDLIAKHWKDHFRNLVRFSEEEVKREFLMTAEKRKIRYVLLTLDAGRKKLKIADADVEQMLKNTAKLNLAKARYEESKEMLYKGKTFDQVKLEIGRELLGEEKTGEVRKINEALADSVAKALTANPSSDAAVQAILKGTDVKVQTSGWMARGNFYLAGAGDVKDVEADAFADQMAKTKKYTVPAGVIVAVGAGAEKADLSKLNGSERESMISKILTRKENELYGAWMKDVTEKSKIVQSSAIAEEADGA